MLQPSNRLTLIDAMRPPPGFGFESAMGVTFTLDLRALLAAPAAFALTGADLEDDGTQVEPIELLHAVRAHAGKLTVFSQLGEIALPPSRRVFAFLERSVVPVDAPLGGVIHPKAWVLRFAALDDPDERRPRVLIASRNLTFDASWDTLVRLDESAGAVGADLSAIGALFVGLLAAAPPDTVSEIHAQRVASLSAALHAARFALPDGVDEIHVAVLGLTRAPSPLPRDAARSLIVSPFLGSDFFTQVRPSLVDEVVSRPESLDVLDAAARRRISTAHIFDDGSSADLDETRERLSPRDPGRPLVGLHAKVFAFERDGRAHVFLGSANATRAAFSRNVELLVELVGPVERLGIERLCEGTEDERGLRDLFLPYTRSESAAKPEGASALDAARYAIADLAIEGIVAESGAAWAVTYRSHGLLPAVEGAAIHCWPLATSGNRRRVAAGEPLDVRFETTIEAISGFLAFEVSRDDGTRTEFLVPVPLHGVPEQRERALLRALVGNAERFLRYLLALLGEDPTQMEFLDALDAEPLGATSNGVAGARLPVLEKLLRTMRRDPGKLAALHALVSDLGDDSALPPGFAELWAAVYDVAVSGERSR